ncbi:MAG: SpoIIE family protein phosphatase [Rhodocyclaceae bacterium]|nr:SpoIIE family protein phosphatase [Rhodocyclaceae bacterium]
MESIAEINALVLDNIVDGIVTIDDRGIMISVNPAVPNIFGYEQVEELVGQNVSMLMPEPHRSAHDGYLSAYLRGGMPNIVGLGQVRFSGQRKNGSVFPVELGVTELRLDGRRIFVGILRDISERVAIEDALRGHTAALQRHHEEREAENALAGKIMERLMQRGGLDDACLQRWLMPASDFSGDAIAAARAPDGRLYVLLSDATGHGLAAAVSAVPVLTTFYSLVDHGYPLGYMAYEINRQLMAFLPVGRFVAANLVCVDTVGHSVEVWVGGMPEPLLIGPDGVLLRRFTSEHPPMGIVEFDEGMAGIEKFDCPPGSQLALYSDGLTEAGNGAGGEAFGEERLIEALASEAPDHRLGAVLAAFNAHTHGGVHHDDISLLLVDC